MVYDRYKTRIIKYYGGLVQFMPVYATIMFFFILGNISFPGTSAFVAEVLVMLGVFADNTLVSVLSAIATIFGALTTCGCLIVFFLVLSVLIINLLLI